MYIVWLAACFVCPVCLSLYTFLPVCLFVPGPGDTVGTLLQLSLPPPRLSVSSGKANGDSSISGKTAAASAKLVTSPILVDGASGGGSSIVASSDSRDVGEGADMHFEDGADDGEDNSCSKRFRASIRFFRNGLDQGEAFSESVVKPGGCFLVLYRSILLFHENRVANILTLHYSSDKYFPAVSLYQSAVVRANFGPVFKVRTTNI